MHTNGTPAAKTAVHDVLIVGFGPVGQTLAVLLAQKGHDVVVVERWTEPYPKPRAVVFDDEVARIFASAGIADRFADVSEPSSAYEWRNGDGETLLRFDYGERGPSGWPESNMFTQPKLERALQERAESFPNVTVYRGTEAVQLIQRGDHVEVTVHGVTLKQKRLRAAYVVGCDGANSFVRQRMNATTTDLGFFYDWLICDVIEHSQRRWFPENIQICDPRRPTTMVSGGPGRRRWEFMRMPGDQRDEFDSDDNAWRLLAGWGVTPDNATLEKRALYTFQARWVDGWRDGRLLLAGDAAHLMPPFAGQGMCSGVRDAANLAWKLDLVLRGLAGEDLLTTYGTERSAHVRHAVHMSVELGKVICATDPEVVAERDRTLIAAGARPEVGLPPPPPAVLGPGALQSGGDGTPLAPAGRVAVQGRVREAGGAAGLLDEVAGFGFHVLVDGTRVDARELFFVDDVSAFLGDLDARVLRVIPDGAPVEESGGSVLTVKDLDGVLLSHLRACGHLVQIIRPDFYVFGGVPDQAGLPGLLAELAVALGHRSAALPTEVVQGASSRCRPAGTAD
ncbi:bifunctional 3-(3-hydroxy-phenyl)propionate/3-hydroxycinnamic acid hydroxylase [Nonomuraea turkmeniaca]|uniref:Bifunctional 3-(3-hydroxy-phenyl)propionate/3-hydroxycinnamic acid hydroxylase n=1 Tax=Nonomuraea turkmeniaca TaxID=103838 RepID=A0A5S4FWA2_9ACTN|nr:bifunctional 3-(3-hydroxy-phenyl)propionate/3-hydroxycinnamic acid hydroxylase [Nonomuraea turkmeniaca]TMR24928.1 bifunctional 3-(3-hydroxy-phenyl)propionate/3-hydroxycinnamic acid hydroxylase [Nonomuraea turkmeniaca]